MNHERDELLFTARGALTCRGFAAAAAAAASTAALSLAPASAFAGLTTTVTATGGYQHNSNVFDLQSGANPSGLGDGQRGDSFYSYGAALDLDDRYGRQEWFLKLAATEFRYDRFTQLDHNEYNVDGGWNWQLGSAWSGVLEVVRNRVMVPFTDLTPQAQSVLQLPIQTEQRESGQVKYQFAPDWRIEAKASRRGVDEPLAATPELHLNESFGELGLDFLGKAGLTSGFSFGYLSGNYSGGSALLNPSYTQKDFNLNTQYQATGRSTFVGQVGYSKRTSSANANDVSGITGKLQYTNQLTGKTSLSVGVSRSISSFIANSGSEIDTTGSFSLNWQATYKILVSAGYEYMYRDLASQPGAIGGIDGIYRQQNILLNIDYEVLRWLAIKPYASVLTRSSDIPGGDFNSTIYGINFVFKMVK